MILRTILALLLVLGLVAPKASVVAAALGPGGGGTVVLCTGDGLVTDDARRRGPAGPGGGLAGGLRPCRAGGRAPPAPSGPRPRRAAAGRGARPDGARAPRGDDWPAAVPGAPRRLTGRALPATAGRPASPLSRQRDASAAWRAP